MLNFEDYIDNGLIQNKKVTRAAEEFILNCLYQYTAS